MFKYSRHLTLARKLSDFCWRFGYFSYTEEYPHVKVYRWLCFEYVCVKDIK